jgi:adenosylmethionine-8-amino-7-oxononanoate aminotransferase
MALGVTACTAEIHEGFVVDDKTKTFFHGHSFTANPISCTAALASLEIFEKENTLRNVERINRMHLTFGQQVREISGVENVRVCGTVIAFELKDSVEGYTSSVRDRITSKALEMGVYLRPLGNTVYVMPPYCISEAELQKVYEVILSCIV